MFKKGFSLVEILIVIAIIGILATILIPNLNESRLNGYDAKVQGNLLNAQLQSLTYAEKYGGYDDICDPNNEDGINDFGKDLEGFKCIDSEDGWTMVAVLKLEYPGIREPFYCVDSKKNHLVVDDSDFDINIEWDEDEHVCE